MFIPIPDNTALWRTTSLYTPLTSGVNQFPLSDDQGDNAGFPLPWFHLSHGQARLGVARGKGTSPKVLSQHQAPQRGLPSVVQR
jgi:hypothetical protein